METAQLFHGLVALLLQEGQIGGMRLRDRLLGRFVLELKLAEHLVQLVGIHAARVLTDAYLLAELGQLGAAAGLRIGKALRPVLQGLVEGGQALRARRHLASEAEEFKWHTGVARAVGIPLDGHSLARLAHLLERDHLVVLKAPHVLHTDNRSKKWFLITLPRFSGMK